MLHISMQRGSNYLPHEPLNRFLLHTAEAFLHTSTTGEGVHLTAYFLASINIQIDSQHLFSCWLGYIFYIFHFYNRLSTTSLFFNRRLDYFLSLDFTLEQYLFHLRDFHPLHLRLSRTSYDLSIQDFHLYFITINIVFSNPDLGIVVERSPSAKAPYGLRNTLGCFAARTVNSYVVKPSQSGFPIIVV